MPSKKKLRKRNRKLRDQFEHLYSSYQRTGREAWEAATARDKAVRDLRRLQTAAWELLNAIDNGRQDDLPVRKDALRGLLPEIRGMSASIVLHDEARGLIEDEQVPPAFKQPDWAKVLDNDTYAGFTTSLHGNCVPLVKDGVDGIVHNHGSEECPGLACRETRDADGRLRGECMGDAA
ncbi:hypothetical protein ACFYY5_29145 [Nocardia elegans]|uniref:Uncharacterized protein n=1 Tax=Nocardia elegans TaxID=300029 RepID=A0ABW6TLE8_9NOCA